MFLSNLFFLNITVIFFSVTLAIVMKFETCLQTSICVCQALLVVFLHAISTYSICHFVFFFAEHQNSTTLDLVGEQLWCGALYLADFILHNPDIFTGAHVLEVASGVGLTSIIASMFAKKVTVTGELSTRFIF